MLPFGQNDTWHHKPLFGAPTRVARSSVNTVLRVTDARTGRLTGIPAPYQRLLRMSVSLPCAGRTVGLSDVRVLLVGDVLLRTVESDGLQVVHALGFPDLPPEQTRALGRAITALGIHPPSAEPGGEADVQVFGHGDGRRGARESVSIEVGRVHDGGLGEPDVDGDGALRWLLDGSGVDPLAIRLALLTHAYGMPMSPSPYKPVVDAERTLSRWRRRVADWARAPSKPIPDDVRFHVRAALAEDLETAGLVRILRRVEEDADVLDGAKFETFVYVDRVLGLELAREVGRV
ncbi:MAG: hypothetical protein QOF84_605 [Streptomyces sp.]|nr:hypothetical protein [Streptomyces sp.]